MKAYRSTFGLLVLGCLAAPFAANAQFGTEPAQLSLVKVRDDVYVIRNPFVPGNTTAVITGERGDGRRRKAPEPITGGARVNLDAPLPPARERDLATVG